MLLPPPWLLHRALAASVIALMLAAAPASTELSHQDASAPRILFNVPSRAIEYQLSRLSNEELMLVERKENDIRYRPVYLALLTRSGLPSQYRDEALRALIAMERSSPTRVILEALGKVRTDSPLAGDKLLGMLYAQPQESLTKERDVFLKATDTGESEVRRAAYGALIQIDQSPEAAWQMAAERPGHLSDLLRSVPHLGKSDALFAKISALIQSSSDQSLRAVALSVIAHTRADAATFDLLAREVLNGNDPHATAAAIRGLQILPEDVWPPATLEPLARAIVANVERLPAGSRTQPPALDALQFGQRLAARLPADIGRAVRRDLRGLGVQVVRIQTIPEKLAFDLRWFVVEAAKPVQIVLVNPDAMPHNLLITAPGALETIGTTAATMAMPTDPAVKPFVPNSPSVLQATHLLKEGETARLGFLAPKAPGEYPFVCTFPGHWVRMYGVMLVVETLEGYEAKPTVPIDPMTKAPFTSQRN